MPVLLPATPLPKSATPRPLDYGAWQEPIAGGTITRLDRPGTRMAVDVVTPQLRPEPDGRLWAARLLQAVGTVVRMAYPQPWRDPATPSVGPCVVNGAGQGGMALAVRGGVAGAVIKEGQALNVFDAAGRPYVHFATADTPIAGNAVIPITPMLRTAPADGSSTNIDAPVIEGRLTGYEKGWTLIRAFTEGLQFTISELR